MSPWLTPKGCPDTLCAMEIMLNGESFRITTNSTNVTLADLLEQAPVAASRYAIELNQEIVPKSLVSQTPIQAGDKVEIIVAVGGG